MKNFIAECHRRRVFRVAALYIVGAWVVLQVADLAFEAWDIPSTALRFVWIGAILGLPAALMFGWRYDVVGGAIVATPGNDDTPAVPLQRIDYLVLSALGIMMVAVVLGLGAEIRSIQSPSQRTLDHLLNPQAIAVLPFADSDTQTTQSDFLALGIQDDLLTRLSKIASLKVISRSSVERYRESDLSIPEIGTELGVGRILEGGVQRFDDQIRVNVQLIDANSDEHIWSDTFDRSLTASNIFDIQTEIVETIIVQLKANLTPRESQQITVMPTRSLEAYTIFLKGQSLAELETVESLNAAIVEFNQAVEIDPDFALAFVGLADAYLTLGINFYGGLTTEESLQFAEPPLVRALEIDPEMGQAYAALGRLRQQQMNYEAAEISYEKAIDLQPNYPAVFRSYGRLRWYQDRPDEAGDLFAQALELDPYSAPSIYQYARYLDAIGEFDAALEHYLRVADIEPNYAFTYVYIAATHFLVYGRIGESLVWYQKAALHDPLSPSLQSAQAVGYLELGQPDTARYWVEKALALGPDTFWAMWSDVLLRLYTGDDAGAQERSRAMIELFPRNQGAHKVLRNADIEAGRYAVARSRYARAFRELVEPEVPSVNADNYQVAVDLALVLIHLGEHERADDLLQGSLDAIKSIPRMGVDGYWITDVDIYSLQNRPEQALQALHNAIDEGWRFLTWLDLEFDPNVDSIRDHPRFQELTMMLEADLAKQSERVLELQQSGELVPIVFNENCVAAPATLQGSDCDRATFLQ